MPRLILESKDGTRRELALNGPRISVGRSDDNNIELADTLVSRRHAELVWDGGGYVFRDLDSQNGSVVNGAPAREHRLVHGDEIVIGSTRLFFDAPEETTATASEEHRVEVGPSFTSTGNWKTVPNPEEALAQATERFELLDRIGRSVLSADSLDTLLNGALELVLEAIDAERAVLQLWSAEGGSIEQTYERHRDSADRSAIRVPRGIVAEVVQGRVAVVTSDAKHDERFAAAATVIQTEVRSALCVPLWEESSIHGVVYLDSREQT